MPEGDSKKVVKQLRLMLDNRDEESWPLIEEWLEKVKEALAPLGNVTITGQNYLILDREAGSGKVARVEDYDPETRDFKEGKAPPAWAGGPHKLDSLGNKIPIEGAPITFRAPQFGEGKSKRKSTARPAPMPAGPTPDEDEDLVDLDELDMKAVEGEAESVAESTASDAAKKFKLKKK